MKTRWTLSFAMLSLPLLGFASGATVRQGPEKEILNKIGMRLVLIPAGKFVMGLPLPTAADDDPKRETTEREETARIDEDAHEVEITKPFYMGKYEVTQAEFEQVMGVNPSHFRAKDDGKDSGRLPVEKVSWYEAKEFCTKLSKLEGKTYTLPTEAEWEYACRAETRTTFHFGNVIAFDKANYDSSARWSFFKTNADGKSEAVPSKRAEEPRPKRDRTTPVGSFAKNDFGLFDMHGNVFEWCEDWYSATYYGHSPAQDPPGPAQGKVRVMRGGSWFHHPSSCRAAYRTGVRPDFRSYSVGFRVVLRLNKEG